MLQVAQLLLTSDEAEMDHLVSSYGEEGENYYSPLPELDNARVQLVHELSRGCSQARTREKLSWTTVPSGAYLAGCENPRSPY